MIKLVIVTLILGAGLFLFLVARRRKKVTEATEIFNAETLRKMELDVRQATADLREKNDQVNNSLNKTGTTNEIKNT